MGSSIEIGKIHNITVNRVNGVTFSHMFFNATDKVIKYITFTYVPFNSVGDPVQCTISGKSEVSAKLTGPMEPYSHDLAKWENVWYNGTVKAIKLARIHVEYMDGTEETINGDDAGAMFNKNGGYNENSVYYEKAVIPEKKAAEERKAQEEIKKKEWAEEEKKRAAEQRRKNIKMFSNICLGVAIFFLLGAFGSGTSDVLPVILGIAAVAAAAFAVLRFKPELVESIIDKIKAKKD